MNKGKVCEARHKREKPFKTELYDYMIQTYNKIYQN